MKTYMSETGNDMHDSATRWHECKATTLQGAKAEATRKAKGFADHYIHIGTESGRVCKHTGAPEIITISSRRIADKKWRET